MTIQRKDNTIRAVGLLTLLGLCAGGAGPAGAVSVIVDGTPVTFAQPPVEKAGRVFVPLRGVFEKLGASVVYQDGLINATGDGHDISLRIGSVAATVDGRSLYVDTAPFMVGDTTLVPLRFISQALGAGVHYDDASDTVTITSPAPPAPPRRVVIRPAPLPQPPPPVIIYRPLPPPPAPENLAQRNPDRATNSSHPSVSAEFTTPADPNSVHVQLDGRDVEQSAYVSTARFQFETPDLPPGPHTVRVFGRTAQHAPFDKSWTFTSGNDTTPNTLDDLHPHPGDTVGSEFTVSGRTLPGARVRVAVATSAQALGGVFRIGLGTFDRTITADGAGHFSVPVRIEAIAGGTAELFVQSTAPGGAATTRRVSLKT